LKKIIVLDVKANYFKLFSVKCELQKKVFSKNASGKVSEAFMLDIAWSRKQLRVRFHFPLNEARLDEPRPIALLLRVGGPIRFPEELPDQPARHDPAGEPLVPGRQQCLDDGGYAACLALLGSLK